MLVSLLFIKKLCAKKFHVFILTEKFMKRFLFFLSAIFLFFYTQETIASQQAEIPDSLLNIDNVYRFSLSDSEKSLAILAKMRERKMEPEFKLDLAIGDTYSNIGKNRLAIHYYNKVIQSDSVKNNIPLRRKLLHRLATVYELTSEYENSSKSLNELFGLLDDETDELFLADAKFALGRLLYYQKDERAFDKMEEALKIVEKNTDKIKDPAYYYLSMIDFQTKANKLVEAMENIKKAEALSLDTTNNPLAVKNRKGMLAMKAVLLFRQKDYIGAEEACRKFMEIKTFPEINPHILSYLIEAKKYDMATRISSERENYLRSVGDTAGYNMKVNKNAQSRINEAMGNYKKALSDMKEATKIDNALKSNQQKDIISELSVIYETKEKDAQIAVQQAGLKQNNMLLFAISVIVILLLILLFIFFANTKKIREKNRLMVSRIRELQQIKSKQEILDPNNQIALIETNNENNGNNLNEDDVLFKKLSKLMKKDKIYQNPDLTRNELAATLGTNKNRLATIVQSNTGQSVNDYINSYRLESSLGFLEENDNNERIESVASLVGLSKSSYYRLFRQKYGMTPKEYKQFAEV